MITRSWIRRLFGRTPRSQRRTEWRQAPAFRFRPAVETLEQRLVPATFADNGTTLNLILNKASTNVALVSNGSSYAFTLTGDTWSGSNDANVTGNGTATLTVTSAGIAAFTSKIGITDAAARTSVTFNDSGAKTYAKPRCAPYPIPPSASISTAPDPASNGCSD